MKSIRRIPLAGLVCSLISPSLQADNIILSEFFEEPAVVFNSTSLTRDQLPMIIRVPQYPAVFRNEINLGCIALRGDKHTDLVYLTQSKTCVRLDELHRSQGKQNTTGMNWRPGFETEFQTLVGRLEGGNMLIIQPRVPVRAPAGMCSCDGNLPPEVVVDTGENQIVISGDPVLIEYSASDADSEVLMDTFSYQFNGGPSQSDLPAGLFKNCTTESGALDCSVSGTAPVTEGLYAITLEVSDGLDSGFATAFLTVVPEGLIFLDGFEETP